MTQAQKIFVSIIALLFFFTGLSAQAIVKSGGVFYTNGAPTHSTNFNTDAELAIDTTTGYWYEKSRDGLGWLLAGFRIQETGTSGAPTLAPADKQSYMVINAGDSLYHYRAAAWRHINQGTAYTGGTGISVTGTVITNTGDLSTSNEGVLGVGAGSSTTSTIISNTTGATGVTVTAGTGLSIAESTSSNGGTITLTNSSPDQTVSLTNGGGVAVSGSYPNFTLTATDQSTTNEVLTISDGTNSEALGGQTLTVTGGGINVAAYNTGTNTLTITGTEIDGTVSNEGSLTVGAGSGTTSLIQSNTSGSTAVTLSASTGISISESGNTITLTNSSPDQTVSITNGGGIAVSGTYPAFTLTATDQSITNENLTITDGTNTESLAGQTLTVTGAGINTAVYNTGTNTLTITGTEVDGSVTNEIQTYGHSGTSTYTNTLSGGGGSWSITGGGIAVISQTGGAVTVTATEVDGSTTNEVLTISDGTNSEALGGQTLTVAGAGINVATYTPGTNTLTITGTEVDGLVTNEGSLTVAAGGGNDSQIHSNTSGSTDVVIAGGTNVTVTESGSTIIISATPGAGVTDLTFSGTSSPVTLNSSTGTDVTFTAGGINTFSATGTNITITGTEVDGVTTNEGSLTVGAGSGTTSLISSNTSGSTDVTLTASTGLSISESGNVITLTNSAPDQTISITNGGGVAVSGTYPSFTLTATDQSITNEVLTITDGTNTEALGGQTLTVTGAGINTAAYNTTTNTLTITGTEVDGSTSNELQTLANTSNSTTHTVTLSNSGGSFQLAEGSNITLTTTGTGTDGIITIAATGAGNTDLAFTGTSSPITLTSSTGTDVTFTAAGINSMSASGSNITITATEVDGSISNELQTYSHGGTTTYTNTLSNSGGSWSLTGAGIAVISQTAGAVTVTATEVDGSISNEGSLTVGAGSGTTSIINSNTSGSTGVTVTASTGLSISESGNVITLTNSAPDQTVSLTNGGGVAVSGTYPSFTLTATDQSTTNEVLTISDGTNTEALGGQTLVVAGAGINVATYNTGTNTLTVTGTEVDGSISNEGSLTVGAGTGTTSIINSNTSGSTGVTLTASTGLSISESGNVVTLTNSSPDQTVSITNGGGVAISGTYPSFTITATDQSITNELQTITNTSNSTTHTATLSSSGGSIQLVEGANITLTTSGTGLDGIVTIAATSGSGTDLSVTGTSSPVTLVSSTGTDVTFTAGGINAISASSGNITITATEVDGSVTNELQTIANTSDATSHTVTLSNSGGSVQLVEGSGITMATTGTGGAGILTITAVDASATNEIQTYGHAGTTTYTNTLSGSGGSWSITGAGIAAISQTGGAITVTATEVDGSVSNELQTYSHGGTTTYTNTLSNSGGSWSLTGAGIAVVSQTAGAVTVTATEVDGSISNEGSLTVGAGSGTTSIINSNTSGSTGVTLTASTGLGISESGNVITLTNSSPDQTVSLTNGGGIAVSGTYPSFTLTATDQSTTNELQTVANTSDATSHTVTLSNSGGSFQLVEGSGLTITTSGTSGAGIVTIAAGGGGVLPTGTSGQTLRHNGTTWVANSNLFHDGTDVGIGTTTPNGKLHVVGTIVADGSITSRGTGATPTLYLYNTSGEEWHFKSNNDASLSIGNPTIGDGIVVAGATGATTIYNTLTLPTVSGTATTVMGRTSAGVVTTLGLSGLSIVSGTLTATGGSTDLAFTGTSSPVTLTSSTGTDVTFTAGGINTFSASGTNITITGTEVDGSVSNEGSLTVGAGTGTTSLIQSNTSGSTNVTITAGTGLAISESGNTITLSAVAGSSVDSTWAKINGSYANKRITDPVFRYAPIGLNTTDTTGRVNIGIDSASTRPAILVNYKDESNGGFNFFSLRPKNQTGNGGDSLGNFNFWATNYPGINVPNSGRANHVWRLGYNTGSGGGRLISTDADLHIAFESNFYNFGLDGIKRRQWEWHLQSQDTKGIEHRVITAGGSHNGNEGSIGFNSDGVYFSRYNTRENWMQANRFTRTWRFIDSMEVLFNQNGIGAGGIKQRNAANTGFIDLIHADGSDRVYLGGGSFSRVAAEEHLQITGSGLLSNESGLLLVGNSTYPTRLAIEHSGSSLLTLIKTGATYNSTIGISGTTLYASSSGGSTPLVISLAAPNNAINVASSGNVGFGASSPAAIVHAVSTSGATAKMIRVGNTTGYNDFYRSTATPEGAITADPGDLALTNISSTGKLWLKETGGGNTGWSQLLTTTNGITGGGTANQMAYFDAAKNIVSSSNFTYNSTDAVITRTYTNTRDMPLVLNGNVPGINFRATTNASFSLFNGYFNNNTLSLFHGSGTSNPSTNIANFTPTLSEFLVKTKAPVIEATDSLRAGNPVTVRSRHHIYASGNEGLTIEAQGRVGLTLYGSQSSGDNRVWKWESDYFSAGKLSLLKSTTNAGSPTTNAITIDKDGKVGIVETSPAEALHVTGNIRADGTITTRGTGTSAVVKMINTTPSTGRQWDMVSDDDGDWFLTNSSLGVSLSVSGTTGDVNIPDKLILSSLASTPTSILGINASNEVSGITVGSGLTLSAGVLSASGGGGATDLTFSGASSPVTLASSTGTDVTFVAGTGITLSQSSNALTINATNSGAILNGGNITGATLVIGTNDANALQFETNNVPRVAITGGASTGGAMTLTDVTANTSTIENALVVQAQSSGTAATGFGTGIVLRGESSTTNDRDMFSIGASWTTATDASRVAKAVFSVANNTALSESFAAVAGGITIGASAQPTLTNASFTTAGAYTFGNSANNTTLGGSTGLVTISSSATSGNPILLSASGNSSSVSGIIGNTTYSYGSGTKYEWRMNSGYTPSSGTGAFYNLGIFATISHSGASGDCGAINIEPTQTVGYKYRAIRIAGTNSSDIYPIHQIGSAPKSIFEGSITIGTTSPQTEKLNVWGNIQLNTGQIYCATKVLTDGATIAINWNNSNSQRVVLGGNRTITFSNPKEGAIYVLKIAQDATGSRTLTWPTVKWKGGAAPILSTAANAVDVITLMYIGAEYLGEADLGFQ